MPVRSDFVVWRRSRSTLLDWMNPYFLALRPLEFPLGLPELKRFICLELLRITIDSRTRERKLRLGVS